MDRDEYTGRSLGKRAVFDMFDFVEKPPVKKSAESVPPPEVLELQRKLKKSEDEKQRLIRIAGELRARVEFLEGLVDTKPVMTSNRMHDEDMADVLGKRVICLMKELEQEKSHRSIDRVIDQTRSEELAVKLVEATDSVKNLAEEYEEKMRTLTEELAAVRKGASDDRGRDLTRINQLTCQLAQYESGHQQLQRNNIFKLNASCGVNALDHEVQQYDAVVKTLRGFEKIAELNGEKMGWYQRRKELLKDERLYCNLCDRLCKNEKILDHFYSAAHKDMVAAFPHHYTISLAAVAHWTGRLTADMARPLDIWAIEAAAMAVLQRAKRDREQPEVVELSDDE